MISTLNCTLHIISQHTVLYHMLSISLLLSNLFLLSQETCCFPHLCDSLLPRWLQRKSHKSNVLLRTAPKSHVSQFCCLFLFSSLRRICLATTQLFLSLSRLSIQGTMLLHVEEPLTGRKQSSTEKCLENIL